MFKRKTSILCLVMVFTILLLSMSAVTEAATLRYVFRYTPSGWQLVLSPATAQPGVRYVYYRVQPGDTLSSIGARIGSSASEIRKLNCLSSDLIYAGQLLLVPVRSNPQPNPAPKPSPTPPAPEPEKPAPKPQPEPEVPAVPGLSAAEQQMLNLVNQERTSRGLAALKADLELTRLARLKSQDMINLNYFAHQSPTYGSPFDMMRAAGISYRTAGENLAGASSVERAHNALMNSPGHRANILNSSFTHVGIGAVSGGPYGMMFTQMFVGR